MYIIYYLGAGIENKKLPLTIFKTKKKLVK